jgi:uncharacterized protein with beta-barrel porin domain
MFSKYLFGNGVNVGVIGQNFGSVNGFSTSSEEPRLDPIDISTMSYVRINGQVISGGKTMSVQDGVVYIDGVKQPQFENKSLRIELTGPLNGGISTTSGDVHVSGSIQGRVNTMSGSVHTKGDVHGGANTMSGNITIEGNLVSGNASSMSGSVRVNKTSHKSSVTVTEVMEEVKKKQHKPVLQISHTAPNPISLKPHIKKK